LKLKKCSDPIPEEESFTKSLPKRGHQFIIAKPSPSKAKKPQSSNLQTASLLAHNTSSDSENSDLEKGKLMKPKQQQKKNFSLGDSDDDDEGGIRMKRS
jgi:hypothetical protein